MTFYLADPGHLADAADLMTAFGEGAGLEAAARADRSRGLGNYLHFCRWRQIERLIDVLASQEAVGTVH